MSEETMLNQLLKIHDDEELWKAVQQFSQNKDLQCINLLGSADAHKNPTEISRAQGTRVGLFMLEQTIVTHKRAHDAREAALRNGGGEVETPLEDSQD